MTSGFPVLEDAVPDPDEAAVDGLPDAAPAGLLEPAPLDPVLGDPFEAGPVDPEPSDLQEDPDA